MSIGTSETTHHVRGADPAVVITCDSHTGPTFGQLREYCPKRYLDEFDAFAAQVASGPRFEVKDGETLRDSWLRNWLTSGGHDVGARLDDMNRDGVAAEVIFHGLTASEQVPTSLPFHIGWFGVHSGTPNYELLGVGRRIYDEWLADFTSVEPERRCGLAQLPLWDIDHAVREVRWAREVGLGGVNFPRPTLDRPYNHPMWDPFWAACAELEMPLVTHAQATGDAAAELPGDQYVKMLDLSGYSVRSAMRQMVFGAVFERHPDLKLVFVEQTGVWWRAELTEMDSVYTAQGPTSPVTRHLIEPRTDDLELLPSEYCTRNVFIGATCAAPFEVADAVEHGYESQVLWGSDYPHLEGASQYPRTDDERPFVHLVIRDSFANVDISKAAQMLGGNSARVFGFDMSKLRKVAERIKAPTYAELTEPLDFDPTKDPAGSGAPFCFRRVGAWS